MGKGKVVITIEGAEVEINQPTKTETKTAKPDLSAYIKRDEVYKVLADFGNDARKAFKTSDKKDKVAKGRYLVCSEALEALNLKKPKGEAKEEKEEKPAPKSKKKAKTEKPAKEEKKEKASKKKGKAKDDKKAEAKPKAEKERKVNTRNKNKIEEKGLEIGPGDEIHKTYSPQEGEDIEMVVTVTDNYEFEYKGNHYKSLSKIAMEVTGQTRSGWDFFFDHDGKKGRPAKEEEDDEEEEFEETEEAETEVDDDEEAEDEDEDEDEEEDEDGDDDADEEEEEEEEDEWEDDDDF